jgi:hypothetical protein
MEIFMVTNELIRLIDEAYERPRHFGIYQGVRKFKHGQLFKNVWFCHSIKNQANIACESDLEKQLCMCMEFEEDVLTYRPQPFKMVFPGFSYTPDFIVLLKSGLYEIREAKRECEAKARLYQDRFDLVREHCLLQGVSFKVFTETNLHKASMRKRDFLYHLMRGTSATEQELEDCYKTLFRIQFKTAPFIELKELVKSLGFNPGLIIHLIARNLLISNLDFNTGNNAYVTFPGGQ